MTARNIRLALTLTGSLLILLAAMPARAAETGAPAMPSAGDFRIFGYNAWTDRDWEIAQRVKRATADEIPEIERRASRGDAQQQTILGLLYREGTERAFDPASGKVMRYNASNTKAVQWLRKAADSDYPVAQAELGEMYFRGHGVDRDLTEARRWLERAARADYPRAKLDLFHLKAYEAGLEVMKDSKFGATPPHDGAIR